AALFRVAILTRLTAEPKEALAIGRQALERQKRFVEAHPDIVQYRRDLAASYHNVGYLEHKLGRSREALSYLAAARRIREELSDNQPENLDYQSELAGVLNDVGLAWYRLGQEKDDPSLYSTAEQLFRSARERQRKVSSDAPHVLRYRILAEIHAYNLARLVAELGRPAEAVPLVDEMLAAHPDDAEVLIRAARVLALVSRAMKGSPEAEKHAERAVILASRAFLDMPNNIGQPPLRYPELAWLNDRADFQKLLTTYNLREGSTPAIVPARSGSTASVPAPAAPPEAPRP
ncbi:MAG TPA: tetratricopeptide repeat protein, partial [Gemmata sp.]|nr:tetratricopeptide repeat protein [Gemmata sp.]